VLEDDIVDQAGVRTNEGVISEFTVDVGQLGLALLLQLGEHECDGAGLGPWRGLPSESFGLDLEPLDSLRRFVDLTARCRQFRAMERASPMKWCRSAAAVSVPEM
jgi:hypothetical protein